MTPVEQQVKDEFEFNREEFEMLLDALALHQNGGSLLVEGAALLPELLERIQVRPAKAVIIIPTREFQLAHYSNRAWIQEILAQCEQPETAFRNWMERDARFADQIEIDAKRLEMPVIRVDGHASLDDTMRRVERFFQWKLNTA